MDDIIITRKNLIMVYIEHRTNNRINDLLNMFSENGQLISLDKLLYTGREQLQQYYTKTPSSTPSVGEVNSLNKRLYVDLSFAMGFKVIRSYFDFDDINKITKIELQDVGWI